MRLTDVDLNLLVVFDALLIERNVTKAAQRLGTTQPNCSRALGRLRETFGDPLLVRVGREMQPTPAAERLAPRIREILELADRAINQPPAFDPAVDRRQFVVCCSDYVTFVLMSKVIVRARQDAPGVVLHLLPYHTDAFALLRANAIDVIIEPLAFRSLEGLSTADLYCDRWRLATWAGSGKTTITLDELRSAPYMTYSPGVERITNLADRALEGHGIHLEPVVTTGNLAMLPALIHGTDLVSLVAERGALMQAEQYELVLHDPPVELPDLKQAMYWNPRNDDDDAHTWLRTLMLDVSDNL